MVSGKPTGFDISASFCLWSASNNSRPRRDRTTLHRHPRCNRSARYRRPYGGGYRSGNRWPELFGGELLIGRPVPYPASCRPQAWAAASAGALVEVVLGLSADAPNRTLAIAPISPAPFGATTVRGIRVGDVQVSVSVNTDGEVVDVQAPGLEVVIG